MEDQTPQENAQVFENIDFNSSPEDVKEQTIDVDQEQVLHISNYSQENVFDVVSYPVYGHCYAQCIGVNALINPLAVNFVNVVIVNMQHCNSLGAT